MVKMSEFSGMKKVSNVCTGVCGTRKDHQLGQNSIVRNEAC